ncbi:MAG: flagellar filament capping protein FliD [Bdellovibrionaceae bacterium]|nr:flagellar filament capping protein FliD [Bdellovibrionales bacterium]MCB9084845.1 flagellar filament capping protein FliD [Pseudobdellovibrionaceae bacterium]
MASGLPPNLVDQLVEAERIPIKNLEAKKTKIETRLGLVTDLEEKLSKINASIGTLASTRGFNDIKVLSGDPNIIQGSVDPSASVSGSWNIEVMELAQKASAVTNGFPDKDRTEIGVGYFRFETPDGDKEVYINGSNNTLEGAAAAINGSGVGVRAAVINDRNDPDYPYRLMISGDSVGGDNQIQYPTLYFLDGDQDLYFDDQREARNGVIKVDGFEFAIDDNTVTDIIPGVTLEIKQASPGRQVNVTVKEDQEVVAGKVDEFVKAMNEVFSFIQAQNRLEANTDTTKTLGGDGLLRGIENRMRRLVQNSQVGIEGPIRRLNQIGIEFTRSGTLKFDQDKFNMVLAKDPAAVQQFFAGDGFNVGFIPSLKATLTSVTNTTFGPLALRKKSLQDNIRRVDGNIENKEKMLVRKEANLRRKFANLEETMSRLKAQGGQLAAMGAGGAGLKIGG